MQQRLFNAEDTIAAGARAAVRGERYDVAAIEKALVDVGKTMADFDAEVERAKKRAAWLGHFEQLASASAKMRKLEAAAQAEKAKFEASRSAFFERAKAIDDELREVSAVQEKARDARQRLLDPREVPGTLGDRYREAVADAESADADVGNFQRALREVEERIKSEQAWIRQLSGEDEKEIRPLLIPRKSTSAAESPRMEEHRKALARAERRKAEAQEVLLEAEKRSVQARKVLDALVPEVLKA
jgi:chromosome segregation ATPase